MWIICQKVNAHHLSHSLHTACKHWLQEVVAGFAWNFDQMLPQSVAVSTTQFIHTKANQHASHQHTNCFPSQYSLDLFVGLRYAMTEITTPLPTTNAHTKATNDAAIDFLKMFKCSSPVFPNDVGSVVRVFDTATIQEAFQVCIFPHVCCCRARSVCVALFWVPPSRISDGTTKLRR